MFWGWFFPKSPEKYILLLVNHMNLWIFRNDEKEKTNKKFLNIITSINIMTKFFLFYFLLVLFFFFLPFVCFDFIRCYKKLWKSQKFDLTFESSKHSNFWLRVDCNFFPRLILRKKPGVYMETSSAIIQTMWLKIVIRL